MHCAVAWRRDDEKKVVVEGMQWEKNRCAMSLVIHAFLNPISTLLSSLVLVISHV